MNITAETTGTLQQQITIEITSQDYKPKVATELKKIAQRVVIPGFRPGKAPAGMVQRTYGGELTIDTINNIINTELDKYITENKLNIFGYPMPAPDQKPADFDKDDLMIFKFGIGLIPEINIDLTQVTAPKYEVTMDEPGYQKTLDIMRKQVGTTRPDTLEATDKFDLSLNLIEESAAEGTKSQFNAHDITIDKILDAELSASLVGAAVNAEFVCTLGDAFGDATKAAELLKSDVETITSSLNEKYIITLNSVLREGIAEMNQEFFDKLLGKDVATDPQAFEEKFRTEVIKGAQADAEQIAVNSVAQTVLSKQDFEMPDSYLIRLFKSQEKEKTQEEIEAQYPEIVQSLKKTLVVDTLLAQNNVQITTEDLIEHGSLQMKRFFAQYNIPLDAEQARKQAQTMLKDEKQREKMADEVKGVKLYNILKTQITFVPQPITFSEFEKVLDAQQQPEYQD